MMKARRILLAFLSSLFLYQCAFLLEGKVTCGSVTVLSKELTLGEAQRYCRYAAAEREKVEKYWGKTWREPIRIHVSSQYRISRALIPGHFGDRRFMEMPLRGVQTNTGALLHEIVHIYAPGKNRFLAEGLAVYLHEKLAGNPGFPNFMGEDFRSLARAHLGTVDSLRKLNAVKTPVPLERVADERTAYILGGSFAGYLIEKYGLDKFKRLYDSDDYAKTYGKPLAVLEKEWRRNLEGK